MIIAFCNQKGEVGYGGVTGIVKKFTIRIDAELLGRIRAAYLADLAVGRGPRSMSAWAAVHLERAVRVSEATSGHAFSPLETGTLPTGPIRDRPSK